MPRRFKEFKFPSVRRAFPWAGGVMTKNEDNVIVTESETEVFWLKRNGFVEIHEDAPIETEPDPDTPPEDGGDETEPDPDTPPEDGGDETVPEE